jgi:hypothetical protein
MKGAKAVAVAARASSLMAAWAAWVASSDWLRALAPAWAV